MPTRAACDLPARVAARRRDARPARAPGHMERRQIRQALRQLALPEYGSSFGGRCEACAAVRSRASGGELTH